MGKKTNKKKTSNVQNIYYQRTKIRLYYPVQIRKGCCEACKRCKSKGEIKVTQRHHTKYAYETKTVLKNPALALENSLELCFGCHPIADGLRDLLLSNPRGALRSINRIIQVVRLLPPDQQAHFTKLCRAWLREKK